MDKKTLVRIEGESDIRKDESSTAVINCNDREYQQAIARLAKPDRLKELESRVDALEAIVQELLRSK